MLGFSLPKIILLVFIIFLIWYGFKMLERRSFSKDKDSKNKKSSKKNSNKSDENSKKKYTDADYTEIDEDNER